MTGKKVAMVHFKSLSNGDFMKTGKSRFRLAGALENISGTNRHFITEITYSSAHISYVIVRSYLILDFITWAHSSWNQMTTMTSP
jgi:hypothetical protein